MWLPAAAASAAADAVKPVEGEPAVSPDGQPLTVLLVDDEFLVVMGTQAMLEDLGHTVLTAGSGEEALQQLRLRGDIDLVITDQAMPAMSGVQLAAAIEAEWPGLPVILVTGYADLSADVPPMVPKLTKPVDQATLSQAIAARIAARDSAAKIVRLHAL
jgi:CheY-like chemotaxis protein